MLFRSITNENGSRALGKAVGRYTTIDAPNLKYSLEIYEKVCKIIAEEIQEMADIRSDMTTLVVGLGNRDITPDALGTGVISRLLVTRHIKARMNEMVDESISGVCAIPRRAERARHRLQARLRRERRSASVSVREDPSARPPH